jgi:hypothetical protein
MSPTRISALRDVAALRLEDFGAPRQQVRPLIRLNDLALGERGRDRASATSAGTPVSAIHDRAVDRKPCSVEATPGRLSTLSGPLADSGPPVLEGNTTVCLSLFPAPHPEVAETHRANWHDRWRSVRGCGVRVVRGDYS